MTHDQVETFRATYRASLVELTHYLVDHGDAIAELAIQRAVDIGVKEYGDTTFHKRTPLIRVDVREELADALFYQNIITNRQPNNNA